jgi:hypothetical protein
MKTFLSNGPSADGGVSSSEARTDPKGGIAVAERTTGRHLHAVRGAMRTSFIELLSIGKETRVLSLGRRSPNKIEEGQVIAKTSAKRRTEMIIVLKIIREVLIRVTWLFIVLDS